LLLAVKNAAHLVVWGFAVDGFKCGKCQIRPTEQEKVMKMGVEDVDNQQQQ
jgi:hypothetical protein